MAAEFHDGSGSLQDRDMIFLATADAEGRCVARLRARAVYPNRPRSIHRYELSERSRFVPRGDGLTQVPEWKRSDRAADALPANDPARNPGEREVLGR